MVDIDFKFDKDICIKILKDLQNESDIWDLDGFGDIYNSGFTGNYNRDLVRFYLQYIIDNYFI